MATYSINVGTIYEAQKYENINDVLQLLPNNTAQLINPKDLRDSVFTTHEIISIKETSVINSTIKYIGIDNTNNKQKIFLGKKELSGLEIMNDTLLNSDTDLFIYNNKIDSNSSLQNTKISFLAGDDDTLFTNAPYVEIKKITSPNRLDMDITNLSGTGSSITLESEQLNLVGDVTMSDGLLIGNTNLIVDGVIRWTGSDLEVGMLNSWKSLTSGGLVGVTGPTGPTGPGGGGGGATGIQNSIQYSDGSGNFSSSDDFTWDNSTRNLSFGNNITGSVSPSGVLGILSFKVNTGTGASENDFASIESTTDNILRSGQLHFRTTNNVTDSKPYERLRINSKGDIYMGHPDNLTGPNSFNWKWDNTTSYMGFGRNNYNSFPPTERLEIANGNILHYSQNDSLISLNIQGINPSDIEQSTKGFFFDKETDNCKLVMKSKRNGGISSILLTGNSIENFTAVPSGGYDNSILLNVTTNGGTYIEFTSKSNNGFFGIHAKGETSNFQNGPDFQILGANGGSLRSSGGSGNPNTNGGHIMINGGLKKLSGVDGNVILGNDRGSVIVGGTSSNYKFEVVGESYFQDTIHTNNLLTENLLNVDIISKTIGVMTDNPEVDMHINANTIIGSTGSGLTSSTFKGLSGATISTNDSSNFLPNFDHIGITESGTQLRLWVDEQNVLTDDTNIATAQDEIGRGTTSGSDYTKTLNIKNFNFNLPNSATINGIEMDIRRRYVKIDIDTGLSLDVVGVRDNDVRIDASSDLVLRGDNKSYLSTDWGTTTTTVTYGSSSDLWGQTWSDVDINGVNFGTKININLYKIPNGSNRSVAQAQLEYVLIRVYYVDPGGSKMVQIRGNTSFAGNMTLPKYTTTERNGLTPNIADIIYNLTTNKLNFYNGVAWEIITSTI